MRKRHFQSSDNKKRNSSCIHSKASVYHAVVVIFLEFFAFGLLTAPMITVLDETFPKHTFLMNGLIQGVKGFLSFLSAPLIGAMSDVFGRKPFLLLTVTFTCSPIPLLNLSHWWYFTAVSISGIFAVTFSVVFAYVADVTAEEDRSWAYGLVSATFAASLVVSPTVGAYLGKAYSDNFVVALATAVALLDVFFILACVPESLPHGGAGGGAGGALSASGGPGARKISWEKADPFGALRRIGNDYLIMMLCIATFLSYLPEAGQYSCFFVYLRLVLDFSEESVAFFIGFVGIFSCLAQTGLLAVLMSSAGPKLTIIVGLAFETVQLSMYGWCRRPWMMWVAGGVASLGSITYPAISAFVSKHAAADQQGVAQGVLTGIRGLCNGLGPAVFGCIFYLFQVDLTGGTAALHPPLRHDDRNRSLAPHNPVAERVLPGPPFAFGAVLVLLAILVSLLIPNNPHAHLHVSQPPSGRHRKVNYVAVSASSVADAGGGDDDDDRDDRDDDGDYNADGHGGGVGGAVSPGGVELVAVVRHADITDRDSLPHGAEPATVIRVEVEGAAPLAPARLSVSRHGGALSRGLRLLRLAPALGPKQATS